MMGVLNPSPATGPLESDRHPPNDVDRTVRYFCHHLGSAFVSGLNPGACMALPSGLQLGAAQRHGCEGVDPKYTADATDSADHTSSFSSSRTGKMKYQIDAPGVTRRGGF